MNLSSDSRQVIRVMQKFALGRDPYSYRHAQSVARYAYDLANEMGVDEEERELIRLGAELHDVGKLMVPADILNKPTQLDKHEFHEMHNHTLFVQEMLSSFDELANLVPYVEMHHIHFDGTGYPEHARGQEPPLGAQIITLADAVDAMASDRPYRKGLSPEIILEELKKYSGVQFSTAAVEAFNTLVEREGLSYIRNAWLPEESPAKIAQGLQEDEDKFWATEAVRVQDRLN